MLRGLIKGDNAFVPTAALRVAVRSGVDVAALLVTERGRVRGTRTSCSTALRRIRRARYG